MKTQERPPRTQWKPFLLCASLLATTCTLQAQAVDADGDTWTDAEETALGTQPNNAASFPKPGTWVEEVTKSAPNYWWRFEETDVSTGTPNLGSVEFFDGAFGFEMTNENLGKPSGATGLGTALEFTGPAAGAATGKFVDFGAEIPELINLRGLEEDRATTVEYWINTTQVGSTAGQTWTSPAILGRESPADGDMYWGWFSGSDFAFSTSDLREIESGRDAGKFINDGKWHHIVLIKDWNIGAPSVSTMHIDGGSRQGGLTLTRTTPAGNASFQDTDAGIQFLGFTQSGSGDDLQYIGLIDEVAIYNRALTDTEVRLHYAAAIVDTDGDGLSDQFEDTYGLNKNVNDALADLDNDGLDNLRESQRGTIPNNPDTDNDGLMDGVENNTRVFGDATATGTDPRNPDTDGDGLLDGVETHTGNWVSTSNRGTSPLASDTDGDGYADSVETNTGIFVSATNTGTNPNRADTDGDGFDDRGEVLNGSNPSDVNSIPRPGTWLEEVTKSAPRYFWRFEGTDPFAPVENLGSVEGFDGIYGAEILSENLGRPTPLPNALGTALEFTGPAAGSATQKYVDFGAPIPELINPRPNPQQKSTTVEYWINTSHVGTTAAQTWTSPAILARESGGDGDMYWGWITAAGEFGFSTSDFAEIYSQRDGGIDVTDGRWHHIVLVKEWKLNEVSRSVMYIDGGQHEDGATIVRTTTAGAASFQDEDGAIQYLGFTQNGGEGNVQYIGLIDELAIYDRALSEAEVRLHYASVMRADADNDQMLDVYEVANGLNPAVNDAGADADNDSSTNLAEFQRGTNPRNPDTDADGLLDGVETGTGVFVSSSNTGTDPFVPDTDDDGLLDAVETNTGNFVSQTNTGTNPHMRDSDGDGFDDRGEILTGSDPNDINDIPQPGTWIQEITKSQPAYWWRFEETDPLVPTENRGSVAGFDGAYGPEITAENLGRPSALPALGTALEFTGPAAGSFTGKYVDFGASIPELINLRSAPENKSTSVEYWIRTSHRGTTANQTWTSPALLGNESPADGDMYWGFLTAEDFAFSTSDMVEIIAFRDGARRVVDGQWHHIVLVKEWHDTLPTRSIMYVDGGANEGGATIIRTTATGNPSLQDDDAGIQYLGFTQNGGGDNVQYIGLVDEVAIYNRALSEAEVRTHYRSVTRADSDSDGMPDFYEIANGFNPAVNDAAADADNDGSPNLAEFQRGTDPRNPDTDGDGLLDGVETGTGVWVSNSNRGTDPFDTDSDNDTIPDAVETNTGTLVDNTNTGTNPNEADTDGDGFSDNDEITLNTNPNNGTSHIPTGPNYVAVVQGDAPLYYWRFEETNPANVTPNLGSVDGFDGMYGPGILASALGKESATPALGNALEFTGPPNGNTTPKYVNFGAGIPELINLRTNPEDGKATTVEYWIKTSHRGNTANQTWTSPAILARESGGDGDMYWGWFDQDGQFGFSTSDLSEINANNLVNGEWHHIVMVKIWREAEPSISRMYVDGGALNGGMTFTATTAAGSVSQQDDDGAIQYLGFTENGGGQNVQYIGLIDEVAIYNKAFIEAHAYAHFKAAGGVPPGSELRFNAPVLSDGQLTISWTGAGGVLQEADTVTGEWRDVTPQPAGNTYTIPATGNMKFYRLRRGN